MLKDILKLTNDKVLDCHKIVVEESYTQILNDNDREVYYETSNGYWYKAEYNEKGKEIYYENSNGRITDNRPKTVELTIEEIQSKLGFKVKIIEGK